MNKSKYVTIVNFNADDQDSIIVLYLASKTKAEAFEDGAFYGRKYEKVHKVYIAKRIGQKSCKILAEVRKNGEIVTDSNFNGDINQVWENFL